MKPLSLDRHETLDTRHEKCPVSRFSCLVSNVSLSRSNRGFTLIEMMVYLMIISIVLTAAAELSFQFAASQAKGRAMQEAARNARFGLSRVALEVREAAAINYGDSVFGTSPARLSLATDDAATNPTIITVSDGRLWIKQGSGTDLPLTSSQTSVGQFLVDNLTKPDITKNLRLVLTVDSPGAAAWADGSVTVTTTAQVKKNDGFN